jgi:uncharacterized protein YhbP (UPF0306 family)
MNLTKLAKKIIRENIYCSLATTDGVNPWTAPLYYAVDKDYNFYFISQLNSRHTKHILKNPNVAFSIFDSHQPEGTGNGIQASGRVRLLKDEEIPEALKWYQSKFIEMKPESFMGKAPYRFFKIIPKDFYVLDPEAQVDKRVKVKLK